VIEYLDERRRRRRLSTVVGNDLVEVKAFTRREVPSVRRSIRIVAVV
jgi:hypothetical protein